ncbi:hypothetical protein CAOG_009905 [Capsaspora owczarzaki ATCC 30864]|uniref:Uncharacterized protein n=1 Tax=Capsaspora owczarzaki (strain ATCC 30864) TaxID=595528 RepID=A0A0D2VV29_CAPO3|nr:hypothetical protein CAOG_009905 [Capsaspora owczarzaki ATCC 30864]
MNVGSIVSPRDPGTSAQEFRTLLNQEIALTILSKNASVDAHHLETFKRVLEANAIPYETWDLSQRISNWHADFPTRCTYEQYVDIWRALTITDHRGDRQLSALDPQEHLLSMVSIGLKV